MCQIAGVLKFNPHKTMDGKRLAQLHELLSRRGLGTLEYVVKNQVGFGRLKSSVRDAQLLLSKSSSYMLITYSGELYNSSELRAKLEQVGCRFSTTSDAELVLQAYATFDEKCVHHFSGKFAFGIWDRPRQKLFLARDRLGVSSLYFAISGSELLFASEVHAFDVIKPIVPEPNPPLRSIHSEPVKNVTRTQSTDPAFTYGENIFFDGIHELAPGRTLSWSVHEGLRWRCYWGAFSKSKAVRKVEQMILPSNDGHAAKRCFASNAMGLM